MSLTGRTSPGEISQSSPPAHEYFVGTAVASGTHAATSSTYYASPPSNNSPYMKNNLYSVFPRREFL
jgi:hypothetical protein